MTRMRDRLAVLEQVLGEVGSPLVDHLRPGSATDAVTGALAARGIDPHPEIVDWFGWHDGTDLPSSTNPPGMLLPADGNRLIGPLHVPRLDEAVAEHDDAVTLEAEYNPDPRTPMFYWPGWFPVLRFTDSWLVCVDTRGTVGPEGTLFVFDVWRDNNPPRAYFPSLAALVDAVIDTYNTGQVSPTQLVIDPDVLPASAKPLNY